MWFSCAGLVVVIFMIFFDLEFSGATSKSFESRDIR